MVSVIHFYHSFYESFIHEMTFLLMIETTPTVLHTNKYEIMKHKFDHKKEEKRIQKFQRKILVYS